MPNDDIATHAYLCWDTNPDTRIQPRVINTTSPEGAVRNYASNEMARPVPLIGAPPSVMVVAVALHDGSEPSRRFTVKMALTSEET